MHQKLIIVIFLISSFIIFNSSYSIAAETLTINNVNNSPDPFSPDGDGTSDTATISAIIHEPEGRDGAGVLKILPVWIVFEVANRVYPGVRPRALPPVI